MLEHFELPMLPTSPETTSLPNSLPWGPRRAVKKISLEVVFRLEYFGWGLAKESWGEWAGPDGGEQGLGVVIHHPEKNPGFETRGKQKEKKHRKLIPPTKVKQPV